MKEAPLDLPFPHKGLDVHTSLDDQPDGTTPQALNVRSYDPRAGRLRGGQRSGMTKYLSTPILGTGFPIQDLNHATYNGQAIDFQTGAVGGIAVAAGGSLPIFARGGQSHSTYNGGLSSPVAQGTCWDQSGNNYSLIVSGSNTYVLATGPTGTQLWLSSGLGQFSNIRAAGIVVGGGFLWVALSNSGKTATFLYKLSLTTGAVSGSFYNTTRLLFDAAAQTWPGAASVLAYAGGVLAIAFLSGYVQFYNTVTSVVTEVRIQAATAPPNRAIDTDGTFFYVASNAAAASWVTKFDFAGNQQWQTAFGVAQVILCLAYDPIKLQIVVGSSTDNVGGLYNWETLNASTGAVTAQYLYQNVNTDVYGIWPDAAGGYVLHAIDNNTGFWHLVDVSATNAVVWDVTTNAIGVNQASSLAVCQYGNPVSQSLANRFIRSIAVSQGTVVRFNSVGSMTVTNGSKALNPGAAVVFSDQMGTQLFFVDGVSYKYYDCPTDSILTLTASAGSLPVDSQGNAARLMAVWRNCLVLSGLRYDPNNWFISAKNSPGDWNYAPVPAVETQAVAGNNATAGVPPSPITALVPFNDEILIMGQSTSIFQMTGHPAAGGRIDLISDGIGMAWGRPYCRDGQGVLYFMSNRGSVYKFVPGGLPERISDPIAELLLTVGQGTYLTRMAWDERQFGFHVWITQTTGRASTYHYFYDVRGGSWWQDQYANTAHNPLAVHVLDGETAGERLIILGGWDGYIRKLDPAALDDDGTAIASNVFLGPIKDPTGNALLVADLQASLDSASSGVIYSLYAGRDAQAAFAGTPVVGAFAAGRNRSQATRVSGHALYVQLSSLSLPSSSWQLEYLRARVRTPEGKSRQRAF